MQKSDQDKKATEDKPVVKLKIRRNGGCFSTLSLVASLLLILLIFWLTFAGLPECALRAIEETAAEQGYHIRMRGVYLAPARGLAVRVKGFELRAHKDDKEPVASIGRALFVMPVSALFTGDMTPKRTIFYQVRADLPVTDAPGESLTLTSECIGTNTTDEGDLEITQGDIDVSGISVNISGVLKKEESQDECGGGESEEETKPFDLAEALEPIQKYVNDIHRFLRHQNWEKDKFPSLDIQPSVQNGVQQCYVAINVPAVDIDQFHFRNGRVELTSSPGKVTVDRLNINLVNPDSKLSMQGAYYSKSRELGLVINSDIPIISLANRCAGDKAPAVLKKFKHAEKDTPAIQLYCNVQLQEDYTPENIRISGEITQKNLSIGQSFVNVAQLSFRYNNGDFSMKGCELTLPEGKITLDASAKDGTGSALLTADIDHQALLRLVEEFTDSPMELPDGISLHGQTHLEVKADLTVPLFKAGSDQWQQYTPDLSSVKVTAKCGTLGLPGCTLKSPEAIIQLNGIDEDGSGIPTGINDTSISLSVEELQNAPGEGGDGILAKGVTITAGTGEVELADLASANRDIKLHNVSAKAAVNLLQCGEYEVEGLSLTMAEPVKDLHPMEKPSLMLDKLAAKLAARNVRHQGTDLGGADFSVSYNAVTPCQADICLNVTPPGQDTALSLTATTDWTHPDKPELNNLVVETFDLTALSGITEHFDINTAWLQLPKEMTIKGDLKFDAAPFSLRAGEFSIDIPGLVREATLVPGLRGQKATIDLNAKGYLYRLTNGVLAFDVKTNVKHATGVLDARIQGAGGIIAITGDSTIRVDQLDILIDYPDAHEIIRDFRFDENSKCTISNIDTKLDFSDPEGGRRVDSYCDVVLEDASYLICGIEVLPDGTERVRKDMGPDPFSYVYRVSCGVRVDLAYDCHDPQGNLLPDKCTITMSNACLDYKNEPWLRRQKFKTGDRRSLLTGDAIIIDTEACYVEIQNVRGRVYPAYAFGMFYPDLQKFMEDVIIPSPLSVDTKRCVFPYEDDSPVPFSGTIRAVGGTTNQLRMLGTNIPLEDFSGFIHLEKDAVLLDRLNATCWDGVANASLRIGFGGKHTSFDGYVVATCANLKKIAAAYGSDQNYALCDGRIRFRAPSPDINAIQAYGDVHIADGNLLKLGFFRPVGVLLSDIPGYLVKLNRMAGKMVGNTKSNIITDILDTTGKTVDDVGTTLDKVSKNVPLANHLAAYDLRHADCTFNIEKGHFITKDLVARGINLRVNGSVDVNLNNMKLDGHMWPHFYSLTSIALTPITFLSSHIIHIGLTGTVKDMHWGIDLNRRLKGQEASASSSKAPDAPSGNARKR